MRAAMPKEAHSAFTEFLRALGFVGKDLTALVNAGEARLEQLKPR